MSDDSDFFDRLGSEVIERNKLNQSGRLRPGPEDDSEIQTKPGTVKCWSQADNFFYGVGQTYQTLPPGIYRCDVSNSHGYGFSQMQVDLDALVTLPDSASSQVLMEIRKFRSMKDRFQQHGFLYKRGVMLYGPPGGGKTVTVAQLSSLIVEEEKGISIFVDHPEIAAKCFQLLRRIELDRPILAILEDLDALVSRHGENEFLALLDGESQIDNICFVATSNYPERLDRRFVDRPSRFDIIKYIGMPSMESRRVYLQAKCPYLNEVEIEEYVRVSDQFSLAHLRELVVLTRCLEFPLEAAAHRLDEMRKHQYREGRGPEWKPPGFTPREDRTIKPF